MSNDPFIAMQQRIKKLTAKPTMTPYEAGKDCAINGANADNCALGYFASPQSRDEWERGKEDGDKTNSKS